MKKRINAIIVLIIYIICFVFTIGQSNANIDVTVSPIRYEITLDKWTSTNKTIKVFNNSNESREIFITTRNAVWMDENWQPKFVEEIEASKYHLADWITPWVNEFVLWPGKSIDIPIHIRVYKKASPWWHYWAVFFNIKENTWWQISVQKRIWVLLLLKVPWVVQAEWEIKNIAIVVSDGWGWSWNNNSDEDFIWKVFRKFILWEKDVELTSAPDEDKKKTTKKLILDEMIFQ